MRATFTLKSPAKINLGLEILGKRPDGFHEIATIFLAVNLYDSLEFADAANLRVDCSDPELEGKPNLVLNALQAAQELARTSQGARVTLTKRIPLAAGLGGASSNAATTLLGCQELWRSDFGAAHVLNAATELGSDVPFFLNGGCALGRGRGELLKPVRVPIASYFVLVTPDAEIENKTASLYANLRSTDFSDGEDVLQQERNLNTTGTIDTSLLVNAFARPLYARIQSLETVANSMWTAGAGCVALSGAGPTHYAIESDPERATDIAHRVQDILGDRARVEVVRAATPRTTDRVIAAADIPEGVQQ